jgi:hypothetical protein
MVQALLFRHPLNEDAFTIVYLGFVLVGVYFVLLFRLHRGKVAIEEDVRP